MTKKETKVKIVAAASKMFRERGVKATTVPDVMQACGLTVGGFYKHFVSKEDLFRTAMDEALKEMGKRFAAMDPSLRGEAWKQAVAGFYLTEIHRDNPGAGCALAAMCGDVQRADEDTRRWFEDGLQRMIAMFAEHMEGDSEGERRAEAWQFLAGLVGGLIMSRSVADRGTSREILDACRAKKATAS
jgi:TetR/AcrR family transcriptional repressor of nem operon